MRSQNPIVLEVPTGNTTATVIQRVLSAADVPYGLEQAPRMAGNGLIDSATRPDRVIELQGLALRDALDAIVREDPRYQWTEVDGRIRVRSVAVRPTSALDHRVGRLLIKNAALIDALAVLVDAIDPSRPRPTLGQFGLSMQIGEQSAGPTRHERLISVGQDEGTLLETLDAMARSHGQLSWTVSYAGDRAGIETASITLITGTLMASAVSPRAHAEMRQMRERLMVPVMRSFDTVLSFYTQRARVRVGVELLEDDVDRTPVFGEFIDLTNVPPPDAIARIVALDSRFEWRDAGEIFDIRPKSAHARQPSLLERTIDTFTVTGVTAEGALNALIAALGGIHVASSEGEGGLIDVDRAEQARRIAAGRAKTVSLTLRDVTVREILNAICREHGTLSWSVRPQSDRQGRSSYGVDLNSYDGWSLGRTFALSR